MIDILDDDDYVIEMYECVFVEWLWDQVVLVYCIGLFVFDNEFDVVDFFYGNDDEIDDEFFEDEDDENGEQFEVFSKMYCKC